MNAQGCIDDLKSAIAYARWAGCSKCAIDVETARYILALLTEKGERK